MEGGQEIGVICRADDYVAVAGLGGLEDFRAWYVKPMLAERTVIVEVRDGPLEAVTKGTMRMVPVCSPGPPIRVYAYSERRLPR